MNIEDKMNNVETEVEEAEILEAEVVESQRPARSGILPGLVALVALIVAVGGALFSYQSRESVLGDTTALKVALEAVQKETVELDQKVKAAQDSYQAQGQQLVEQKRLLAEQQQILAEQQQALAAHKKSVADQDVVLEQERARLEQAGQEVREAIRSVHQRIGGDNSHWMAAEAAYLIQIANHRLQLEWDVQTAISALQTADERLRDSADPSWIPVREILALEITSLKGVGLADIEGLALKLSSLAGGVKELKLRGTERVPAARTAAVSTKKTDAEARNLETLMQDAWEGFKSIMVIRHHGQPVSALLPPDQQLFIQQNLQLQLEAARVSLLRGNQALFDSSLQTAIQLLKDYFDTEEAKAKSFLKEIGLLSKLSVRPQMPDISNSLIALREQLKKEGENR